MIDCLYPTYDIKMLKAFGGICPKCDGTGIFVYKYKEKKLIICNFCKGLGELNNE